jgi:threonine dehydratase
VGRAVAAPTREEVLAARDRILADVTRTPLLRFPDAPAGCEIRLKLENLQPIGSFKLRGALSILRSLPPGQLGDGVYTASAGNMAQGVAWAARALGIPASVVVPDRAPRAKLDAIERLGATILTVPYAEWWATMQEHGRPGMRGVFVHPFADARVMAGNATIALEIVEDFPSVDAVIVPWGGGGLACGIAAGLRAAGSAARVYACEVEGAAPLRSALDTGEPHLIENRRSFVDGIGGRGVFPEMWPLARQFVADSLTVSVAMVASAVRDLVSRTHVVAEGAGAAALAGALEHHARLPRLQRFVCVVSGGNIDTSVLASILNGSNQ